MQCKLIHQLHASDCRVSHAAVACIAAEQPGLRRLELYWNANVRDATVYALAGLMHLQHLSLSGCNGITDEGVRTLSQCCTQLTTLDLTRCVLAQVVARTLSRQFSEQLLEYFELSWCQQ